MRIGSLVSLALLATRVSAATFPAPTDLVRPNPEPALPAEFAPFTPPVDNVAPAGAAPVVSEWTRTAGPDETLVLAGWQWGPSPRFVAFGQTSKDNATLLDARAAAVSTSGAAITVDARMPAGSMYLVWPVTAQGAGAPVAINRAEAWWVNPQTAARGETVSVYGRNLSYQNGKEKAWVLLQPAGQPGVWAKVTEVNPYKVDFVVPDKLAKGAYEVWVHNGHGGHCGWHTPGADNNGPFTASSLTVAEPLVWDGGTFDVRKFGAKGDGTTDDTAAIKAALAAASAKERATLFFPAGTYMIADAIAPVTGPNETGLRLLGEGKDKSVIKCLPASTQSGMIVLAGNNMEVRDLAFRLNSLVGRDKANGKKMLLSTAKGWRAGVKLINCIFDGEQSIALSLGGYRDLLISDCEITANENQMGTANSIRVDQCKFYGRADAGMALYWLGGYNISVTRCTAEDYDKSGPDAWDQFQGRFIACTAYGQRVDNWYIAHNKTINLTVRPQYFNQNTGEQLMWETIDVQDQAMVQAATASTVTFSQPVKGERIPWYANAVVVAGKGLGQSRQIMKYDASTRIAELSRAWRVVPDSSSVIAVSHNLQRVVVYENELDGKPRAWQSDKHIASAGVEPFGGSHTLIVDGNTFHELRCGIATFGLANRQNRGVCPTFFNLYCHNTFDTMRNGILHRADADGSGLALGLSTLGTVARGNTLRGIVDEGCTLAVRGSPGRRMADLNVLEHNTLRDLPVAVRIGDPASPDAVANTLLYANKLDRGSAAAAGSKGVTAAGAGTVVLLNNAIAGFETAVTTGVPLPAATKPATGGRKP